MRKNILTFGSCGWDKIVDKTTKELIYEEEGRKNSHQAIAALRAGANSILVSFVGDDEIGHRVLASLKECGLDTKYIEIVPGASTEVNIQYYDPVTKDYDLHRGPAELSQNYDSQMIDRYKEEILNADAVNLVSKQPKEFLVRMIDFCDEENIDTYLTISHKKLDIVEDIDTLKKVTYIAGNMREGRDLTGYDTACEMLKVLPNMLITDGGEGVWFCDEQGNIVHEPAVKAREVVETNGAGDTFIGNFMVYRAEGYSILECVRRAMCASSLEISKMGVYSAMPYREETDKLYNEYYKGEQR